MPILVSITVTNSTNTIISDALGERLYTTNSPTKYTINYVAPFHGCGEIKEVEESHTRRFLSYANE